ncbi:hypothetical protein FRB98_001315 [Tulasnella sp. 332]|nr:hypothetical protein FRB98_001315 [Tulasnella sp. 332]
MVQDVALDTAALVGMGISLIAYGLYIGLFIACIYSLRLKNFSNNLVNISLIVLFILVSATTLLNFLNVFNSFVTNRDTKGTLAALAVPNPLSAASSVLYFISATITEGLLMWRLYVVWSRNILVCVAPAFIFCCYIVSGGAIVVLTYLQEGPDDDSYTKLKAIFIPSTAIILIIQSVTVSVLIAARLIRMSKVMAAMVPSRRGFYHRIISVIVESAALYALMALVVAILRFLDLPRAAWIILFLGPVMSGLIPTMIVCQLHFGAAIASEFTLQPVSQASTARTGATVARSNPEQRSRPRVETQDQSMHFANRDSLSDIGTVERNWRTTLPEPPVASLRDASHRAAVDTAWSPKASTWRGAGKSVGDDEEKAVGLDPADLRSVELASTIASGDERNVYDESV